MPVPKEEAASQTRLAAWLTAAIGVLLVVVALFPDPIGSSPDTGIIDLGTTGARRLLGGMGSFCLVAALLSLMRNKKNQM